MNELFDELRVDDFQFGNRPSHAIAADVCCITCGYFLGSLCNPFFGILFCTFLVCRLRVNELVFF